MTFEFATAQRIIFGPGKLKELPGLVQGMGQRAALITGSNAARSAPVFQALQHAGLNPAAFSICGEPSTDRIIRLAEQARELGCDVVVAFGGGSVIDAGKALAALLTNTGDLLDYLEVIGQGKALAENPAPCIAIPTTAGTGAEVTRNAVLLAPAQKIKVSMRHPGMLPTVALIDPEQTTSMPPAVTAATGLDAFTQLLEAFVSSKSNPLTDSFCREGLARTARSLQQAYTHGDDLDARTDMALGSLLGGLALANAGLGAVHGFAGPIGGMYTAPHGMVCAALLPAVFKTNIDALNARAGENPAREKYQEAARIITGSPTATAGAALEWIECLCAALSVPGLETFGVNEADIPSIVQQARRASSMKGNPIELTEAELAECLLLSIRPPARNKITLRL